MFLGRGRLRFFASPAIQTSNRDDSRTNRAIRLRIARVGIFTGTNFHQQHGLATLDLRAILEKRFRDSLSVYKGAVG